MRIRDKALKDLSDRELQDELQRRRRARGQSPGASEEPKRHSRRRSRSRGSRSRDSRSRDSRSRDSRSRDSRSRDSRSRDKGAPGWKIRQWYRNLELDNGASCDEVELAYVRLSEKYHPDRHDDPEKKQLAMQLGGGLREAYQGLLETFEDDG